MQYINTAVWGVKATTNRHVTDGMRIPCSSSSTRVSFPVGCGSPAWRSCTTTLRPDVACFGVHVDKQPLVVVTALLQVVTAKN